MNKNLIVVACLAAFIWLLWPSANDGNPQPVVEKISQSPSRHPQCAGNPEQEKCDLRLDELASETPAQKTARIKKMNDAAKAAALEAKKEERLAKARKKKAGVTIGMSKQDALDSSWGRPRDINRTTNARGTSEQWVYDGGYLYFDGDTLTSLQN